MKMQHAFWMFLAIFSGGMAMLQASDLVTGRLQGSLATHLLTLVLFLGASVYFFARYFRARNAQRNGR